MLNFQRIVALGLASTVNVDGIQVGVMTKSFLQIKSAAGVSQDQKTKCGVAIYDEVKAGRCSDEDCCTSMAVITACGSKETCQDVGKYMGEKYSTSGFAEASQDQKTKCGVAIYDEFKAGRCSDEDCCTSMAVITACGSKETCQDVGKYMGEKYSTSGFAQVQPHN